MTKMTNKPSPAENSWAVRMNRWALGWSRHYLRILLIILGVFVWLPFVAPVLMYLGLPGPANVIYAVYTPLCHRLTYRSWFLFGEQPAYPRMVANVAGLKPFELYIPQIEATLGAPAQGETGTLVTQVDLNAQAFIGNAQMGYKVAICERDVAIYLGLWFGGVIYAFPRVRRNLRPVPIMLYILLGLGPIAIDGVSQLLSSPALALWPVRESTPLFRTLTGALFGLMNAWLAFPYLEQTARETIREIEGKFTRRKARLGA